MNQREQILYWDKDHNMILLYFAMMLDSVFHPEKYTVYLVRYLCWKILDNDASLLRDLIHHRMNSIR